MPPGGVRFGVAAIPVKRLDVAQPWGGGLRLRLEAHPTSVAAWLTRGDAAPTKSRRQPIGAQGRDLGSDH